MNEQGYIHHVPAVVGAAGGMVIAAGGAVDSLNGTLIAVGLLVTAVTGAYTAWAAHHTKAVLPAIAKTNTEIVKALDTLNEKSVGVLAAEDETRRIEAMPHDDRNPTEQRHLDQSAPPEAAQGPAR